MLFWPPNFNHLYLQAYSPISPKNIVDKYEHKF